ncbi:hypothetical protein ACFQV2_03975 [Actinokineospora soli]|uniref:Uncharacterized protein n=1 Tax=Actinokineospora soli TaxID=1048753 RepID=A0ABW2TK28_9PSEU
MRSALEVTAWVKVREDCDISYTVNADDEVELLFGGRYDGFELIIPINAVARLADVARRAMDEPNSGVAVEQ